MDRDPVCGRKMNRNKAYFTIEYNGQRYYLCCPLCQAEFERDHEKYVGKSTKGLKAHVKRSGTKMA